TPNREDVGAPLGGETDDTVRPDDPCRQLVTDFDIVPTALAVSELVHHVDPLELAPFDLLELLIGPLRILASLHRAHVACQLRPIADGRRALRGDLLPFLVVVVVVAALKAGRAGEFGFLDDVVERNALVIEDVAGLDAGSVEPPLVTPEQQVRAGNPADAG